MTTRNSLTSLEPLVENLIFSLDVDIEKTGLNHCFHLDYEDTVYREDELVRLIRDSIEYFALTPEEFEEYRSQGDFAGARRRAWGRISTARKESKGDYGELLLFLILYFKLPSRVPRFVTKVRLRSSCGEQIKGFDCAHFTVENDEVYLWLGEAKFHQNMSGAIKSSLDSLKEHCNSEYLKKELRILGGNIEVNRSISTEDMDKLKGLLNGGRSLDRIKFKMPVLLTYDSKAVKNHKVISKVFFNDLKAEVQKSLDKISNLPESLPNQFTFLFLIIPLNSVAKIKSRIEMVEEANR